MGIKYYSGKCPVCRGIHTHWHTSDELINAGVILDQPWASDKYRWSGENMAQPKPVTYFTIMRSVLAFTGCSILAVILFRSAAHTEVLGSPVTFAEWLGSSLGTGVSLIVAAHWFRVVLEQRNQFNKEYDNSIKLAGEDVKQSYTLQPSIRARLKFWRNSDKS